MELERYKIKISETTDFRSEIQKTIKQCQAQKRVQRSQAVAQPWWLDVAEAIVNTLSLVG